MIFIICIDLFYLQCGHDSRSALLKKSLSCGFFQHKGQSKSLHDTTMPLCHLQTVTPSNNVGMGAHYQQTFRFGRVLHAQ